MIRLTLPNASQFVAMSSKCGFRFVGGEKIKYGISRRAVMVNGVTTLAGAAQVTRDHGFTGQNAPKMSSSSSSLSSSPPPSSSSLPSTPGAGELQSLIRYKLVVAYEGTRFKGFQRQTSGQDDGKNKLQSKFFKRKRFKNKNGQVTDTPFTIQEFIEDALEQYTGLTRSVIKLRFAGRTDAGVHARGQVLAISLPESLGKGSKDGEYELWQIRKSINSRLPVDISVEEISLCENDNFDPRTDAQLKRYSYTIKYRRKVFQDNDATSEPISICKSGPNTTRHALDPTTIWVCPWSLDDNRLDFMCKKLVGTHDFSVFVHKEARQDKDNNLTLEKVEFTKKSETDEDAAVVLAELVFESKGFRRSMVRNLVGFLVDYSRGILDNSILDELWSGSDEVAQKIHSAPACGLCLERVYY